MKHADVRFFSSQVDRVLGRGAARALISGVQVHVPHLSLSSMSSESSTTPATAPLVAHPPTSKEWSDPDPMEQMNTRRVTIEQGSFLPPAQPSIFIGGMGGLGRRLSKKAVDPGASRRRSEEAQRASSGGLMARMDRFMGRTPSPSGRMKELDDDVDVAPPPPPIPRPTHGRKHSSSDPSAGLVPRHNTSSTLADRPATTNVRTAAERAEMLRKARKIQQLLGDVPSEDAGAGAFYRNSRAAHSEEYGFGLDETCESPTQPLRVGGRRHSNPGSFPDVLIASSDAAEPESAVEVGRVPSQNRKQLKHGFHRPTASVSSVPSMRPLLQSSPGMSPNSFGDASSPGFDPRSPGASSSVDGFGLGMMSPKVVEEEDEEVGNPALELHLGATSLDDLSAPAFDDLATPDERMEDEAGLARRAKRAKVAKLHRYLGARVPAHLILGLDESWDPEQGLPDARSEDEAATGPSVRTKRKSRRASEGDKRVTEEEEIGDLSVMSHEEKARAVRRKAKMEKVSCPFFS